MKKQILLVGTIIAMTISAMFMGCKSKNDADDSTGNSKPENGCKCTFYDEDNEKMGTEKFDLDDMEDYYDVTTCSKLLKAIKAESDGYLGSKTTCTAY